MNRSRPRFPWVGVCVVVIVVALLVAAGSALSGPDSPEPSPPQIAQLQPSRSSAVQTAVDALYELTIPALTDRARFRTAVVRLAAPGAVEHVEAVFGAADPQAVADYSRAGAVVRGAPLGYRIDRYTADSASVAIWSVAIAAASSDQAESQWRTLVVDLAWTPAGWRVTNGAGVDGPAPSTPTRELAAEAAGFRSFRHEP